uniref:Uncharacterized protein n=1 Tax=Anguilla anguilla TaxID=7936 RepID=A0A0E9T2A7_ANGAN
MQCTHDNCLLKI